MVCPCIVAPVMAFAGLGVSGSSKQILIYSVGLFITLISMVIWIKYLQKKDCERCKE